MTMDVLEHEPVSLHNLLDVLSKFIRDNCASRIGEMRWLASYLVETARITDQMKNKKLGPDYAKMITQFLADEIDGKIEAARTEIRRLESERAKLKVDQ